MTVTVKMMNIFLRILLMSTIALLVSCKKCSEFQVPNFNDADWAEVDPFDARAILKADLALLFEKYQKNPNLFIPVDEAQIFYVRLLQNFQFFSPSEASEPAKPLLCKGRPVSLTEEESLEKLHLLLSWTDGRLQQLQPQTFNEQTKGYFHMLGLKADLDGIVAVLLENTKSETAIQSLILLTIRQPLTDWEYSGEAKLYWWTYNNQRSLLYITHRVAIIFCENSQGEVEVVFCLNRKWFQNRLTNREN